MSFPTRSNLWRVARVAVHRGAHSDRWRESITPKASTREASLGGLHHARGDFALDCYVAAVPLAISLIR